MIVASTNLSYLSGVAKQQRLKSLNNGLADGTPISFDVNFDLGYGRLSLKWGNNHTINLILMSN